MKTLTTISLAVLNALPLLAGSVEVRVSGRSMPWVWSETLNPKFQYGYNMAPTIVSAADGLPFAPGGVLLVQYVRGTVNEGGNWPDNDANGALFWKSDDTAYQGAFYPSLHFDRADYPAFAAQLAGTFADSSGAIVGTPFKVGNSRYLTIPAGATQLQLGNIDNNYNDNSGAWQIRITATNAPTPAPRAITPAAVANVLPSGQLATTPAAVANALPLGQLVITPAVAISWVSEATHDYQVQWASRVETNTWANLGAPVKGNGATITVYDAVGAAGRFYRVITVSP